jgi:hypothetical protein
LNSSYFNHKIPKKITNNIEKTLYLKEDFSIDWNSDKIGLLELRGEILRQYEKFQKNN